MEVAVRPAISRIGSSFSSDFRGEAAADVTAQTQGAPALVKLGMLLDRPRGEPDGLWLAPQGGPWRRVPLRPTWYPDAFIGTTSHLRRLASWETEMLH